MVQGTHEAAPHHLPGFITGPGETDVLFVVVVVLVIVLMLVLGSFYLWLHSLPERIAHGAKRTQFEIVAILALIALFTHNNIFWVAALLLAVIQIPDFSSPLKSMAESLDRLAKSPETVSSAVPETAVGAAASKPQQTDPEANRDV